MNLVIESHIPFPNNLKPNHGLAATIKRMRVGDSVFLLDGKLPSLRSYCSKLASQNAIRLTARVVPGGVRVWRLA